MVKSYCPERGINKWSCALACVVSVCKENNISIEQSELLEKYKNYFSHWNEAPGVLNDDHILDLAEKIGLTSKGKSEIKQSPSENYLKEQYNDPNTAGILIGTHKGGEHCYKLIEITDKKNYKIMNPSTYDTQEEEYSWEGLKSLGNITLIILKK